MSRIVVLSRKKIQFYTILAVVVILAGAYIGWQRSNPVMAPVAAGQKTQVVELVTGEFNATSESGKKLEAYIFYPGTIVVNKGEPVELRIAGVNGQSHPFVIEGLNLSGKVQKGKTTVVRFTPQEEGIYRIVCQTHMDTKSGGPMVGYLVVH
jgi:heme/copper-type cytochrome/quinol oxidase subunit 2